MSRTDLELWEAARAGDVSAFGEIFERYADAMFGFCLRRTVDRAEAEDLVSIVFLTAWRRIRTTNLHQGSVKAWLYGITLNVLRNRARSERRFRAALSRLPRPEPESDFTSTIDDRLEAESALGLARQAIDGLPVKERSVLDLVVGDELLYEDAAAALGVSIATVRSRLGRARKRLRESAPLSLEKPTEDHA